MKKYEILKFLEPFDDEIDIWIHFPGAPSQMEAECKYIPTYGDGPAFVRIVPVSPPAHGEKS